MLLRVLSLFALLPMAMAAQATGPDAADVAAFSERSLQANCDPAGPGAAVLVARGAHVLYRGACGLASLELAVPLEAGQVFRIGSVTKQFAAAATLHLAAEGRLSLDDALSRFLPDYPNAEAISVRMLLDHTSGVRSYTGMAGVMDGSIMRDVDTRGLIASFRDAPPDFAPGAQYRYNNSGYVLLGAVIEQASGMAWHDYLQQVFFTPLGMPHTGYGNAAGGVIAGHVGGYTRAGSGWAPARYLSMTQPHAAGALVSTVDDLLRWNLALHTGQVLSPAHYEAMVTPAGVAATQHYGLGIVADTLRGRPALQHGGGIPGFASYLLYLPDSQTSVVVMANADAMADGRLGPGPLANLLAAYAIGAPYPDKTPVEVPAQVLAQYAGVYRIDPQSTRVIRIQGDGLTSQRTGGIVYPLIPVGADTFVFASGFSRIVFERDDDGAVMAMRFFPEDEGEGEVAPRSDEAAAPVREAIALPAAARERLVGRYAYEGVTLDILLEGDTLKTQLAGQPAFEIFAASADRFFLRVVEADLVFAPDTGPATQVTLYQAGQVITFNRVD